MSESHSDANIRLIRELFEGMLEPAQIEQWDHFFAPIVRVHGPASGESRQHDLSTGKEFNVRLAQVFQKCNLDIQEIFAHKDRVVICWTLRCIHKLEQKQIVISGTSIYRIAKGKITEVWQSWDRLGMLEQLGEVRVHSSLVDLQNNYDTLKNFGMEKYAQQALLLTAREKQCLHCLLRGKTAKETAKVLNISQRTAEHYFELCKGKLNCANKQELFATAQILNNLELL